jgi:lysozyme
MMTDDARFRAMLIRHEALRLKPYDDKTGQEIGTLPSGGKVTIGIGRNITDRGLTNEEAMYLLGNDIAIARKDLQQVLGPYFDGLNPARKAALVDMAFNLGVVRFGGFRKMIAAIRRGDWQTAADEMLSSLWAQQVGGRATDLAQMMRTGHWCEQERSS